MKNLSCEKTRYEKKGIIKDIHFYKREKKKPKN